jgi:hypothetical protein
LACRPYVPIDEPVAGADAALVGGPQLRGRLVTDPAADRLRIPYTVHPASCGAPFETSNRPVTFGQASFPESPKRSLPFICERRFGRTGHRHGFRQRQDPATP